MPSYAVDEDNIQTDIPYYKNSLEVYLQKGNYKIELWGAAGGGAQTGIGGNGGYVSGIFTFTTNIMLSVMIGEGGKYQKGVNEFGPNTYGGGGFGWGHGGSGGGGSYLYIGNTNNMVAAAGGGGGASNECGEGYQNPVGNGGYYFQYKNLDGTDGKNSTGGKQTIGGTGSFYNDGKYLNGGNAKISSSSCISSGGGGGGMYGGGGGYGDTYAGAGGSSYINPEYGELNKTDSVILKKCNPLNKTGEDGFCRITWIQQKIENNPIYINKTNQKAEISYTRAIQTVFLKEGNYLIELWGAAGGGADPGLGGNGGYIKGLFLFQNDVKLSVLIGGGGNYRRGIQTTGNGPFGYGGGGYGFGGSGGGGSFIYIGDNINTKENMIAVAGGGGGASDQCGEGYKNPVGSGGYYYQYKNLDGTNGSTSTGGKQTIGGTGSKGNSGDFIKGGDAVGGRGPFNSAGGGGGGWYGGGGGYGDNYAGSGGSSYINTKYGILKENAATTLKANTDRNIKGQNGYCKITYLDPDFKCRCTYKQKYPRLSHRYLALLD